MIIDGDLAEAMEKAVLTRLERTEIEPGHFTGYVVDATDELVLFHGNLQSFNNFILRLKKTFDEGIKFEDYFLEFQCCVCYKLG